MLENLVINNCDIGDDGLAPIANGELRQPHNSKHSMVVCLSSVQESQSGHSGGGHQWTH